jgi:uncharacterized protein (TIGR03067 family)
MALAWPWTLAATDEPKQKPDAELIQGEWRVTHFEEEGKPNPPESLKTITYVFANGTVTIKDGGKPLDKKAGTYRLDPSKDPKRIDLKSEGEEDGLGIYQLEGDRLSICAPLGSGKIERPKEFKTGAKSGLMLIRLERIKK